MVVDKWDVLTTLSGREVDDVSVLAAGSVSALSRVRIVLRSCVSWDHQLQVTNNHENQTTTWSRWVVVVDLSREASLYTAAACKWTCREQHFRPQVEKLGH